MEKIKSSQLHPAFDIDPAMRWMVGCFAGGIIAVLAVGAFLYQQSLSMLVARSAFIHTQTVIVQLNNLLSSLKDAETGQRGFVITGNDSYLQPFEAAQGSFQHRLEKLQEACAGDPSLQASLKDLSDSTTAKFDELREVVETRKSGGFDQAAALVRSGRGKTLMDHVRQSVQSVELREKAVLHDQAVLLDSATRSFMNAFASFAAALIALFIGFAYFMRRYLNQLRWAHQIELEHKQRLEEFYAILAHELRTPITSINGSLTLMSNDVVGTMSDKAKRLISMSQSEIERMLRLINELLDLKKLEEGKYELQLSEVDLCQLVSKIVAALQSTADLEHVSLVECFDSQIKITCDEDKIAQVLTNLISNAIKFAPSNSSVQVIVEHGGASGSSGASKPVGASGQSDSTDSTDFITMSVVDKGPGIPESQRTRMFQKFYQVDSSASPHKGSGLGLVIAKTIVEMHGGSIGFENRSEGGTRFWFRLPLAVPCRSSS